MKIGEDWRTGLADRTGRRLEHYEAMFGKLPVGPGQTLVNVGAGDSALGNELDGVEVIDVDYGYKDLPPLYDFETGRQAPYKGVAIAAKADQIPLDDNEAACSMSSYLFMHLSSCAVRASIDELIRITAPDGKVLIGPVWDDKNLAPGLVNEYVSFRFARYADGWGRLLSSMTIDIPEDKDRLSTLEVSKSLAQSRILGNRPLWRNIGMLAGEAVDNFASGTNRRYDPTGKTYALERVNEQKV